MPKTAIPDSLLKNANALILNQEYIYDIKSIEKATTKERKTMLIINEKGFYQTMIQCSYDKYNDLRSLKGMIYDLSGTEIRKVLADEIKDVSLEGNNLGSDNRMKYLELSYTKYPFILQVEYEIAHKNIMFFPVWTPQESYNISVLSSSLMIKSPADMPIRYKMNKVNSFSETPENEGKKSYKWEVNNLCAIEKEVYSPHFLSLVPIVYTAGNTFKLDNYTGSMGSWQDIGQWYYELNQGRDVVSPTLSTEVKKLVSNTNDTREKVKILYEYMQSRTRYVSIQLGIGGWQTTPAIEVENKGYGDCKALSNFMKALLKAADIPAYQAIIRAGRDTPPFFADFPSLRFNHVILCVPQEKDTIWLECTSQREQAGFLGTFTDNRYALLILPEKSQLVKTPAYLPTQNLQHRIINLNLAEDGNATMKLQARYQAQMQDIQEVDGLKFATKEKQKSWIQENMSIGSSQIDSFKIDAIKQTEPATTIDLYAQIPHFGSKTGKRIFLAPLVLGESITPKLTENRKYPLEIDYSLTFQDTINLSIPYGFKVENLLKNVEYKNEMVAYQRTASIEANHLIFTRKLQFFAGNYEQSLYPKWVEFWKEVKKSDKEKIVLLTE